MTHHTRLLILAVAAASISYTACSDETLAGVTPTPTTLNGTWTRVGEVPGSSEQWILSMTDTVLTATGTWTGEACCSGNLSAHGYVSHDSLHLDVSFFDATQNTTSTTGTPRFTEHVDAVLGSSSDIIGTVTVSGISGSLHMQRGSNFAP